MEKKEYRKHELSVCQSENERRLRQATEYKEKCVKIRKELYGRKLYFNSKTPSHTRDMFATRVFMNPWADNYKNHRRFARISCTLNSSESIWPPPFSTGVLKNEEPPPEGQGDKESSLS